MKTKSKPLGQIARDAFHGKAISDYCGWITAPTYIKKIWIRVAYAVRDEVLRRAGFGETTSPKVATKAAKVLRSKRAGKTAKSIAGSALTQTRNKP